MKEINSLTEILQEHEVKRYFDIWRESVIRSRMTITAVFLKEVQVISNSKKESNNVHISDFLKMKVRKTDLIFQLTDGEHWGILFLQSSEVEARAFLTRIFNILETERIVNQDNQIALKASITAIRNNDVTFDTLLEKNKDLLSDDSQPAWYVEQIEDYSVQQIEIVKVSIIERNPIFRKVLETTLSQMQIPNFVVEVTAYEDGFLFLESNSYKSGHLHLIVMNDILPRKNGLEILHILRTMPNEKKFIIYMMSERNSEMAALNAFEGGVDEYIVKPFNLRLLEAKIKRTFARFWL